MIFCGKATKDRVEFQMSRPDLLKLLAQYGQQWEDNQRYVRPWQLREDEYVDEMLADLFPGRH